MELKLAQRELGTHVQNRSRFSTDSKLQINFFKDLKYDISKLKYHISNSRCQVHKSLCKHPLHVSRDSRRSHEIPKIDYKRTYTYLIKRI